MVERDELLICPVIRSAGCCADASSAHNRRTNAQPASNAEDRSEPRKRMFSLRAEARLTFMRAIFSEVPSCVNSVFCAGHGRPAPIAGRSRRIVSTWLIPACRGPLHTQPSTSSPLRPRNTRHLVVFDGNRSEKWRCTTLLDKPPRDLTACARMMSSTDSSFRSSYWHASEHIDEVSKSRVARQFSTNGF
jgi:hypothetical protein